MKKLYILSLFLMIAFPARSQSWREAVLKLANGDSLRGQIEYLDENTSASQINFRPSPTEVSKRFTTADVSAYSIMNPSMSFEPLSAEISHFMKYPVTEGDDPVTEREKINVFAEVMFKGKDITLYSVTDKQERERFFVRKKGSLQELINITYKKTTATGQTYEVKLAEYNSQVKGIVSDCAIKKKSFGYNATSLIKVFQEYEICKNGSTAFVQKNAGADIRVGINGWTGTGSNGKQKIAFDSYNLSMQLLTRKNNNRFLWVDLGVWKTKYTESPTSVVDKKTSPNLGFYLGTYFGHADVQPLFYLGASSGLFNATAGIGVAWRKSIVLSGGASTIIDRPSALNVRLSVYPRLKK